MRASGIIWAVGLVGLWATEASAQQAPAAEQPDLGLELMGIAAGADNSGLAVVGLDDGSVQFLKVGDEVDGYTVRAIEPTRMVLRSGQIEVVLNVREADPAGDPAARLAAVRREFTEMASKFREVSGIGDGETVQVEDSLVYFGPTGVKEASLRIPVELAGEEFAPTVDQRIRIRGSIN